MLKKLQRYDLKRRWSANLPPGGGVRPPKSWKSYRLVIDTRVNSGCPFCAQTRARRKTAAWLATPMKTERNKGDTLKMERRSEMAETNRKKDEPFKTSSFPQSGSRSGTSSFICSIFNKPGDVKGKTEGNGNANGNGDSTKITLRSVFPTRYNWILVWITFVLIEKNECW